MAVLVPGSTGKTLAALMLAATVCVLSPVVDAENAAPGYDRCPELSASVFNGSDEDLAYRCDLLERLGVRGLDFSGPVAEGILKEMSRPYASVLELKGDVPLPKGALDYLFYELPDTARLVNHFGGTTYQVHHTAADRSGFFATNNRNMQARFHVIDSDINYADSNYLLFESGQAKLMFWRFKGNTIVELELTEASEHTTYDVNVHIFTGSRGFKSFFDSGLFRYLVGSMFRRIMKNVARAALELGESPEAIEFDNPAFPDELQERLP